MSVQVQTFNHQPTFKLQLPTRQLWRGQILGSAQAASTSHNDLVSPGQLRYDVKSYLGSPSYDNDYGQSDFHLLPMVPNSFAFAAMPIPLGHHRPLPPCAIALRLPIVLGVGAFHIYHFDALQS